MKPIISLIFSIKYSTVLYLLLSPLPKPILIEIILGIHNYFHI